MPTLLDHLPAHFHRLLPDSFGRPIPTESRADCADCVMLRHDAPTPLRPPGRDEIYFRDDTKCCTYQPHLPNYLVGAILAGGAAEEGDGVEGRRRIDARITSRIGVDPLWLEPSARYSLLYNHQRRAFGRAASLRCPFYDGAAGGCTIWRHRDAVCSTYFCRHVGGAGGEELWRSAKRYLLLMEEHLARHAALRLYPEGRSSDPRRGSSRDLGPEDLDEVAPPEAEYAARWGSWAGRERDFYRACFEVVQGLGRDDVERLLGQDGVRAQADVERRHAAVTSSHLPPRLRFNPATRVSWLSGDVVAFYGYRSLDPLALPGEAYDLVVAFSGRETVEDVRARLRAERDADIEDDLLLTLYRHRVLVDAG